MASGKQFLSSDEIRPLAKRSDPWGCFLIAHSWRFIITPLIIFVNWP